MSNAFRYVAVVAVVLISFTAQAAELERHTVDSDAHPVALWEKSAAGATEAILLVHGRTWSALPDFGQYNALDASLIDIPTLLIVGEFDPLAPPDLQAKLFTRLGTGHKQYVSVPGGDHAAFLEKPRAYFIHELVAFLRGVSL